MFVHLHRHSEYSRLDGVGTAKQYADRAAELGQVALAQTDHGTLSGALHHIAACREAKILPISGVEAYFRPDRAEAKEQGNKQAWHLCLFAKNLRGWHNLLRIVSQSYAEVEDGGGFYQYPTMDWELLGRYNEGLICSSACVSSWLAQLILGGDSVAADDYLKRMTKLFGEDFFMEIMPHDFDDQRTINQAIVSLANDHSIPLIATNDAHFPYKEWADTHRIAKIMGSGSSLEKAKKDAEAGKAEYLAELTPNLYLAHEEEMRLWFGQNHSEIDERVVDEAIDNTGYFVSRVKPFLLDRTEKLPKVSDSIDETKATLREWIDEGLDRIYSDWLDDLSVAEADHQREVYQERVEYEWSILEKKGVLDYFLLVGDMVRWAKSQGIRVGLGRGSAAGCLISYLIGIVAIDPIPYGLLFERFLNPERKGLPDIDLDFDSERRNEVKEYLANKYGADHVADIITHSTFTPKALLQDLCRAYDLPYMEAHSVTDTIDIRQDDEETTLEELLPINEKLAEFQAKHPEIWKHALRLEGTVRNAGKHAAGVIITPEPIADFMALERGKAGDLVTSWSDAADFPVVSDYGFLKIDFLGIKGLTKHEYACKLIEQNHGEVVDLYALPALRDPYAVDEDTMRGFQEGFTIGVFQFGGRGITNLIRSISPDTILDLTAANALYRPGPMKGGVTWDYAKLKADESLRDFWHESVRPFLEETFGLIAYQEQVMQIFMEIGGGSAAQADDLRKAMGKLYRIKGGTAAKDFMGQYEDQWFAGAAEHGLTEELAQNIWQQLLEFGHYGFNKSHSASYALQAYQDMYLKMHYPLEFYAAFLTYEDDEDKIAQCFREMQAREIEIAFPDVNSSDVSYTVDGETLMMGLTAIKGVGVANARKIVANRPYEDFEDYLKRCASSLKPMIESGAMDSIADRSFLLSRVDKVHSREPGEWEVWEHLKHNIKLKKPRDLPDSRIEPSPEDLRARQGASLDVPLAADNIPDEWKGVLDDNIFTQDEVDTCDDGTVVIVGGEIKSVLAKKTKTGNMFANVLLIYGMNEWRVKLWEKEYLRYEKILTEGQVVMVNGKKDEWNGYISVVARDVALVAEVVEELATA